MTTPKPMKREELPPVPSQCTEYDTLSGNWQLICKASPLSGGAAFGYSDIGLLRELATWLEQANGLSSPPPIASESVTVDRYTYECLQKSREDLVEKVIALRNELEELHKSPAPLAPGELPTIDRDESQDMWVFEDGGDCLGVTEYNGQDNEDGSATTVSRRSFSTASSPRLA